MDPQIVAEAVQVFGLTDLAVEPAGGQKLVFAARRGGMAVMVKLVDLQPPHRDVTLERARREVDVLAKVNHPNVVKLVDGLVELGGTPPAAVGWLEERLAGEDLRKRLGTEWPEEDALALGLGLAHGLAALHDARFVHRDLSAGNVFACTDGRFVLLDPGFARHLDRSSVTGIFQPGTPGFLTPEHVSQLARPGPASDVFGVGILLYLALTAELPIPLDADVNQYRQRLATAQVPSLAVRRSDLDPKLVKVVDRCLQRQSGRRFVNGRELAAALEAL